MTKYETLDLDVHLAVYALTWLMVILFMKMLTKLTNLNRYQQQTILVAVPSVDSSKLSMKEMT